MSIWILVASRTGPLDFVHPRYIAVTPLCNACCGWSGSSPEGVAVDAIAKLLFYTDNGRNTINVARTDNSRDHLIIISYAKHPRTIQIDPMRRLAFSLLLIPSNDGLI